MEQKQKTPQTFLAYLQTNPMVACLLAVGVVALLGLCIYALVS